MTDKPRTMQDLWQDYMFLSSELHKFASVKDIPMFSDLLQQRETLMATIKTTSDDDGYIKSEEGQSLIKKISKLDEELYKKMLTARNMLKKNMEVSTAYEGFVVESATLGSRFDSDDK